MFYEFVHKIKIMRVCWILFFSFLERYFLKTLYATSITRNNFSTKNGFYLASVGLYKRYRFFQEAKKYSKFYLTETSVKRSRVGNLWSWKLHYQNWEINLEVQVVYIIYFLSLCDFQYFLLIYFWYLSDLAKFNYSKF